MKKGLLLVLAALMATLGVTVKAMAGARIDGMATDDRVVEDKDLIFTYANKALTYGNLVDIHLFNGPFAAGTEWGGLLVKDDSLGVIGAYVNRPGAAVLLTPAVADPKFDLFWAKDFTGAVFGVHVNYANSTTNPGTTYNRDMGIQLGLGLTSDSFSQVNFHVGFDTVSAAVGGTSTANTASLITAGALVQKDMDANTDMRYFADLGLTSDQAGANTSIMAIQLGAASNHKVFDGKGLVSSGLILGYANNTIAANVSNSQYTLDWQANIEAQAESWLTVRTGFDKQVYNGQNQNTAGMAFAVGASVNWDNFVVNLNVSPASLANSIAVIQPGNGIFFQSLVTPSIVTVSEADITYKY